MSSPCPGYPVTTPWGQKGDWWSVGWHDGADFAAPVGTPVAAAWSGYVEEVGYPTSFGSAFGRSVVVDFDDLPDGTRGAWGLYAHLNSATVQLGQRVAAGTVLGDVGVTGNTSGPHLHFGVYPNPYWCAGCGIDPQPWIDAGEPTTPAQEDDLTPEQDQLLRDVYNFCYSYRTRGDIGPAALGMWLEDTRIIIGQVSDAVNRVEALLRDNS